MDPNDPHALQEQIMKELGYGGPKSFSTLQGGAPSNKVSFHLNQLQEKNLIQKTDAGYLLTEQGTEMLPYLDVPVGDRPLTTVALFMTSGDQVYLEAVEEGGVIDPATGYLQPPAARLEKRQRLLGAAEALYADRFGSDPPDLSLRAVLETSVAFGNGAEQTYVLFCVGAEIEQEGNNWRVPAETGGAVPGLASVAAAVPAEGIVHGDWDLAYTDGELELEQVDIYRS
ncbi:MAG: hypothetical protein SVW77_00075 [Candidatus Nanohaloarchaea archaeon]|nr:hypothetical protein [Candidatus Nanohaloarchaea archaeon]